MWINRVIKMFFRILLEISVFFQCYLLSMVLTAVLMNVTLTIINLVLGHIPFCLVDRFWIAYLVASVPSGIVLYITVFTRTRKNLK